MHCVFHWCASFEIRSFSDVWERFVVLMDGKVIKDRSVQVSL